MFPETLILAAVFTVVLLAWRHALGAARVAWGALLIVRALLIIALLRPPDRRLSPSGLRRAAR
jgi:hypothetical protein